MADTAAAASSFPLSPEAFGRLGITQKLMTLVILAMLAAVLIAGVMWAREPSYAVLFSIQDEKDGGNIVTALQQQNVPYRFSQGGHTILVPQTMVHDTRLRLAAQGLPKGGLAGFELLENQKMGISQFAEQVNYQRGLEGELARSIQSLAVVKGARVHLAIPKQSAFLREDQKPSASVLVTLAPGRSLDQAQVVGIINLVAFSVPQLNPKNVSVVDQEGKLISQQIDPLRDAGLDAAQIRYVREIEAAYVQRIESILAPIVGASNVRAQVAADIDFSQTDQVAETYRPNPAPATAIRSQLTSETGSGTPPAAGIPGALSNQPPAPATAPLVQPAQAAAAAAAAAAQNFSRNSTVNYEIDKTIRHTKGTPGAVRRLSVAVVVNYRKDAAKDPKDAAKDAKDAAKAQGIPLSENDLKQINELAREAMGFSKERGDSLNVANAAFTPVEKEVLPDAPIWQSPTLISLLLEGGRYLLIAVAAFWLWTRVVRPVLISFAEAAARAAAEQAAAAVEETPVAAHQHNYETKLAAAREMAKSDPKAVAAMIKDWVGRGEA